MVKLIIPDASWTKASASIPVEIPLAQKSVNTAPLLSEKNTSNTSWEAPRQVYITNSKELEEVATTLSQAHVIGLDLETYSPDPGEYPNGGLDPHLGHIRLVTLATENPMDDGEQTETHAFLIDAKNCPEWVPMLAPILGDNDIVKVGHNLKFDLKFLMQAGLVVENIFDTMLIVQLLDAGQHLHTKGYFTLKSVGEYVLGIQMDKTEQISDWGCDGLSKAQLVYAAADASVLLP